MPQADTTTSMVADAIKGLVTREYFDARLETRIDSRFKEIGARFDSIDMHFEKLGANISMQKARWALS